MTALRFVLQTPLAALLGLMWCFAAACVDDAPQFRQEDEAAGTVPAALHVKWPAAAAEALEQLDSAARLDWIQTRMPQVQVTSAGRLFPPAGRFEARTRAEGLHQWYEVQYEAAAGVSKSAGTVPEVKDALWVESPAQPQVPAPSVEPASLQVPAVRSVRPPFNDPFLNAQWYLYNDGTLTVEARAGFDLDLPEVWPESHGTPEVVVAVIDQGVATTHPDLADAMWCNVAERDGLPGVDDDGNGYVDDVYGYNFFDDSPVLSADTHGTVVAGLIGAVNNNGVHVSSVAGGDGTPGSGVRIMSCQIMVEGDPQSSLFDGWICRAFKYAADNGAVICNNSWTYTINTEPADQMPLADREAMQYFITYAGVDEQGVQTGPMRGGLVVCAAGNNASSAPTYPAACEEVLAVTALSSAGTVPAYANYGDWVDLCAYGGDASTQSNRNMICGISPNLINCLTIGTSVAAPQVAAVAALVLRQQGGEGYTPDLLRERLLHTHDRAYDYTPAFRGLLGTGVVSARLALTDYPAGWHAPGTPELMLHEAGNTFLTVSWPSVPDAAGVPVSKYRLYWHPSGAPEKVQMAVVNVTGALPADVQYTIPGLTSDTGYEVTAVAVDGLQRASTAASCTFATRRILPPALRTFLPSCCFGQTGFRTVVGLDTCFTHSLPLHYAARLSVSGVVTADLSDQLLTITATGYGRTQLVLTAYDADNRAVSASCDIVVRRADQLADVWPNPASDVVHVATGSPCRALVRITDRRGETLYRAEHNLDVFSPASVDVNRLSTGLYTVWVETDTEVYRTTLLKQ